jgi:site-specific DNA-cytosine methylase
MDSYNNKVYNDKSPTITTRVSASNLIHLIKKEDMVVIDDKYYLSEKAIEYMSRLRNGKPRWEYHKNDVNGKAACLTANMYKGVPYGVLRVPEATSKGFAEINPNEGVDLSFINSNTRRGRRMNEKSNCLVASGYKYFWYDGFVCRKLTPIECERLQTFPDNWTEGVSDSQRYKALGNSWTVDVISHIFNNLK